MTTTELITHLKSELDPSFTFINRALFIQIDTHIFTPNGKEISVFITNILPQKVIVSDNAYLADNYYFQWYQIPSKKREQILNNFQVTAKSDETDLIYHVHLLNEFNTLIQAIDDLIHCIQELSILSSDFLEN
jgi:hypothetical protein